MSGINLIKRNGNAEEFNIQKLKDVFIVASKNTTTCSFEEFYEQVKPNIVDGTRTEDIVRVSIKACIDLMSVENIEWQYVAGGFLVMDLYKRASTNRNMSIEELYSSDSFISLFDNYIENGLYYTNFYDYYSEEDIIEAAEQIAPERDFEYVFTTVNMLDKRYLLNPNKVVKELPQHMYMAVALFLAIPENDEDRLDYAIELYHACSTQKISLPTPTLMNARTNFHSLSSCFQLNVGDNLRDIYHNFENMAQISKYGGGIGSYWGNIRSRGGEIRGRKGVSGGVMPWLKIANDTGIAVNQLGSRMGSISVTLDIWHRDIYEFLDMQTETGDIRQKAFDLFPSVSIPDLFMKRVQENGNWTLFCPKEVENVCGFKIQDYYAHKFDEKYLEMEHNENLKLKKSVNAKELFKKFLKTTVETGMPYVFFRDTVNMANPNKHAGMVYASNLCTEIQQNSKQSEFLEEIDENGDVAIRYKKWDMVVCNLASINVSRVNTDEEIKKIVPIAMRVLDNVITLNFYPIKEARLTADKYRAVGLGFLGLAEYLATNKISYDSEKARQEVDKLFEKYAYYGLLESSNLAKERGKYEVFRGSDWDRGIIMGKDTQWFINNSQMSGKWLSLIREIQTDGLRFWWHFAPAPNTSTSLITGTTAALLPIYKRYYVESNMVTPQAVVAPNLSQENFWYYKEYVRMDMNDVIDLISVVYKWIDQSVSFEWMIDPNKVSPAELYGYYMRAWEKKIKTVYYVRSLSGEVKEDCESCSG